MRTKPGAASARSIEWNNRFSCNLPSHGDIGETRIHGRRCVLTSWTVEAELYKRYQLIERFVFWGTARETARQVISAVLNGKASVERFDSGVGNAIKSSGHQVWRESHTFCRHRDFIHNRACDGERSKPREPFREIAKPFTEEYTWLDRIGLIGSHRLRSRVAYAPGNADRHQRLMLIVAIGFVLEPNISSLEPRGVARWPVLVKPSAVKRNCQGWRQQSSEGPLNTIFADVATLRRMLKVCEVRHYGFVSDCRIIKRERAGEISIARDPMGMCRIGPRNHCYNDRSAPN